MKYASIVGAAAALISSAAFAPNVRAADAVADFYKDKIVTITVGYGVGGGYDSLSRFYARHMGNHIPGNPQVQVQNMPGAPRSTNHLYNVSPKDGTALGVFASSTALDPLFGSQDAKFEAEKFEWIGSLDRDVNACATWKGAGQNIKTLPDLIAAKKTVIFGASTAAATSSTHAVFLKKMFKANVKVITGYEGTNSVKLAMQRGEMDAACGLQASSVKTSYMAEVKSGEMQFFVQFGKTPEPLFADATMMYSMIKTDEDRQIADLIFGQTEIARPIAAPPGTPKDRVAALRKAMLDTAKDPAFMAEAGKMGIEIKPITGEDVTKMFADYMKTPPALAKKAAEYIQPD
jgi:tripartite-type tricarboxylate transporter receptor subunit TctC